MYKSAALFSCPLSFPATDGGLLRTLSCVKGGGTWDNGYYVQYVCRRTNWWPEVAESCVFIDLCLVFSITILDLPLHAEVRNRLQEQFVSDLNWAEQLVTSWIFDPLSQL